jgi:hypothetical protein
MSELSKLSLEDRIFLAGSIKTMILADGNISASELSDIDELFKVDGFDDFDECLEEFEKRITTKEEYWEMAAGIGDQNIRDIILKYLDEISLMDGFPDSGEKKFFNELVETWNE